MEELIAKLNEAKVLMRGLNVLTCGIDGGRVQILVGKFADVPIKENTEYIVRDASDGTLPYEKRYVENGVTIHTYGTKADMEHEFTGEKK